MTWEANLRTVVASSRLVAIPRTLGVFAVFGELNHFQVDPEEPPLIRAHDTPENDVPLDNTVVRDNGHTIRAAREEKLIRRVDTDTP